MKKIFIIINKQHKLLPSQQDLIKKTFPEVDKLRFIKIKPQGLKKSEIHKMAKVITAKSPEHNYIIVSPIPLLLITIVSNQWFEVSALKKRFTEMPQFYLMHNDNREKVEKDGKIFYRVPSRGWELLPL